MEPLISIIVPVYNVEKYIDECLTSIVEQTYKNLEIILVDDGSKDESGELCDKWSTKDSRVKIIHKKNAGLGMARNSGLDICNGQYICFFDSDDYIEKNTVEIFWKEIKDCDVVYCDYIKFNDEGNEKKCGRHLNRIYKKSEIPDVILDMIGSKPKDISDVGFEVSSCMGIYSKTIIDKYAVRFHSEREMISEDLVFNIDYLRHCQKVKSISKCLYHYRFNPDSLTNRYNPNRFSLFKKLYIYINDNISVQSNNNELILRNKRTFLGHVRVVIREIVKSDFSFFEKVKKNK